jgi:hypothetical protein
VLWSELFGDHHLAIIIWRSLFGDHCLGLAIVTVELILQAGVSVLRFAEIGRRNFELSAAGIASSDCRRSARPLRHPGFFLPHARQFLIFLKMLAMQYFA